MKFSMSSLVQKNWNLVSFFELVYLTLSVSGMHLQQRRIRMFCAHKAWSGAVKWGQQSLYYDTVSLSSSSLEWVVAVLLVCGSGQVWWWQEAIVVPETKPDQCQGWESQGKHCLAQLFPSVFQVAPAEGFSDLAMQVMTSPSKNYILSVITVGICVLFLIGLMCGRITKRVTRELKDR